MSQPLVIEADVPDNYTSIHIDIGRGRGNYDYARLRACFYSTCTNFQYYNPTCQVLAVLPFGESNLTNILSSGHHYLTLDSIEGFASTEIGYAVLNVSFPSFTFSATDKQCIFAGNSTNCSANVTANGSGTCFYPTSGNATIWRGMESIISTSNSTQVEWNCSTGTYNISILLPPLLFRETWRFLDSNISQQLLESTLTIINPVIDEFLNVLFNFSSNFSLVDGAANDTVNLSSFESRSLSAIFSAHVVSLNISYSPITYTFSTSSMHVNITVVNNFSIPFNFSTTDIQELSGLNCDYVEFSVLGGAQDFTLDCSPVATHSFSNWSATNLTHLTTLLTINSTTRLPLVVQGASMHASSVFSKQVRAFPDNFTYLDETAIELQGDFLNVSLMKREDGAFDVLEYTIRFYNPTNYSLNFSLEFDFSSYLSILLKNGNLQACPATICIEDNVLKVVVFNETNFTVLGERIIIPPVRLPPSQFAPTSFPNFPIEGPIPGNDTGGVLSPLNESSVGVEPAPVFYPSKQQKEEKPVGGGSSSDPARLTGLSTALPHFPWFLLPVALLAIATVLFKRRERATTITRTRKGSVTTIVVSNQMRVEMQRLVLMDVLPHNTVLKKSGKCVHSVIGKVLLWKKAKLQPRRKWSLSYSSSLPAKRGKLSFIKNGEKREHMF